MAPTPKSDQVAHLNRPYPYTDSYAGIDEAARLGFGAVDINLKTCLTGGWSKKRTGVCVHYSEWWKHGYVSKSAWPGYRVPKKPIEELTKRQVKRLWSKDGHHTIMTAGEALTHGKKRGIIIFFEAKPSTWTTQVLQQISDYAKSIRVPFVLMRIQSYGNTEAARDAWEAKSVKILKLAKRTGARTVLLYRRKVDWGKWAPVLTAIKGRAGYKNVMSTPALIRSLRKTYSLR